MDGFMLRIYGLFPRAFSTGYSDSAGAGGKRLIFAGHVLEIPSR